MPTGEAERKWKYTLLFATVIFVAYAPALNNGFIADDYVILQRAQELRRDPFFLASIPPEPFRLTTYLSFMLLKGCFGYHAQFYYAFTILLHFTNTLMLWRLLRITCDDGSTPMAAALVFAAIQNPQEGVMWLAGMNEALLATFILSALLLWVTRKFAFSCLAVIAAFFSKESAVVLLALIPMLEFAREGTWRPRKEHLFLMLPAAAVLGLYIHLLPKNALVTAGLYSFSFRAAWVLVNSVHRLCFPWVYLLAIVLVFAKGWRSLTSCSIPLSFMVLSLIPYVFLTYQSHVPSRNQYVACLGLAWMIGALIARLPRPTWRAFSLTLFVAFNVGYLWFVKDSQYVARAAPTRLLLRELAIREPGRIRIVDFPYNPWVAKETTRLVAGWGPDNLVVNEPGENCTGCPSLVWEARTGRYVAAGIGR